MIVVHVAGAVVRPGVYRIADGSRADDAVRAAGGPTHDADLDAVNLASPLADGDKLLIARRGAAGEAGAPKLINLNTATLADLQTLSGVGPATAQKIIDHRTKIGGFRTLEQLKEVPGIGDTKFAQISPHVTV